MGFNLGIALGGALLGGLFTKKKRKPSSASALDAIAEQEAQWLKQFAPQREAALKGLIQSVDPRKNGARVSRFRQQALGAAMDQANRAGSMTRNKGLREALLLDANNRAQKATQTYSMQLASPESLAASYSAIGRALDPTSLASAIRLSQSLRSGQSGGASSFLESILPIFGDLAGSIDWGKIRL